MSRKPKQQTIPDDCMPMCGTCAFREYDKDIDGGFCRRYPPVVFMVDEEPAVIFPVTEDKDWCGEFRRRTS
ncbi:MAG TPA: hypothetical protein VF798_08070 [Burkholderiaceae bacterium]